uniref:GIDE domain-containing protein n=1 Tax=uncultured Jatrophihabitans sp. TaxID=1610747 RepID=UPI0035CB4F2C
HPSDADPDPGARARSGPAGEVDSEPVRPPAQGILDTFGRARPMTVGNAVRVPGSTVRVAGRAAPGPGGPLRAPLSGAECVWYRSVVFRRIRDTWLSRNPPLQPFNAIAPSDLPYQRSTGRTYGLTGVPFGSDRSSTAAFVIEDGTGTLAVDPTRTDVDTDVFAINTVVFVDDPSRETNRLGYGGGPFDNQEVHTEWIIPVGAPLLAVGTVGQGPGPVALLASEHDVALVSTKPEQQILSRNRATVDPAAAHLPFANPRSVYLLVGAVVGVALVVAVIVVLVFVVP